MKAKIKNPKSITGKKASWKLTLAFLLLIMPATIYLFIFNYLPMFGVVMAFKEFNYADGIWGSPWVGLENFQYFLNTDDAWRIIRNTIGYNVLFMLLGVITGIAIAILLYEITNKKLLKFVNTSIFLPFYISMVVTGYLAYIFLGHETGILNNIIQFFGGEGISWYQESKYWPVILTIVQLWKNAGFGSLFYYAALMTIDKGIFEAASIDGASRIKQWLKLGVPHLLPIVAVLLIQNMGQILGGDMGLFYQVPMNSGMLYETTDVVSTYIYRGLTSSANLGSTAAVGLLTNSVGLIMVVSTNAVVKKLDPDSAMF